MIFKELLEHASTESIYAIVNRLVDLYPNQLKNADAYFISIGELLVLEPGDAEGFSLHVTMHTKPEVWDDPDDFEAWAHVFGRNGQTNRDLDSFGTLPDIPNQEQLEWYDSEANWAIELSPWDEILAMEVVTDLPLMDTVAHVLWEITFFGYSNDDVKAMNARLDDDFEEIKKELDNES